MKPYKGGSKDGPYRAVPGIPNLVTGPGIPAGVSLVATQFGVITRLNAAYAAGRLAALKETAELCNRRYDDETGEIAGDIRALKEKE